METLFQNLIKLAIWIIHTFRALNSFQSSLAKSSIVESEAKQKYRGMFETQKSGNKTSSGEIGLNIRLLASLKVGQYQVSSVGMPHPLQMFYRNLAHLGEKSNSVIRSRSVIGSKIGVMSDQWRVSLYMIIIQNVV